MGLNGEICQFQSALFFKFYSKVLSNSGWKNSMVAVLGAIKLSNRRFDSDPVNCCEYGRTGIMSI